MKMKTTYTQTVEDYLKAIYVLQEKFGRAKTSSLAQHLGLTPGSVTDMIKRLSAVRPSLIDYHRHHGVQLTAAGKKSALNVIRRHRLLETFLHQVLGFGWEQVHQEAEALEHHLSEPVTDAIDRLLGYPQTDPHGEVIPAKNGSLPRIAYTPLMDVRIGQKVCVGQVHPDRSEVLKYLDQLGIGIGTCMTVVQIEPFEGPLTLEIETSGHPNKCSLGREVAKHIFIKRADSAKSSHLQNQDP